jgi:hypothetical protein
MPVSCSYSYLTTLENRHSDIHGLWGKTCILSITLIGNTQSSLKAIMREMKVGIQQVMQHRKSPKCTWYYCDEWARAICCVTALNIPQLNSQILDEAISTRYMPYISLYAQFDWYKYVWYHDPIAQFSYEKKLMGQWLGVAECIIDIMAFYILTESGKVIIHKSIWGLSIEEMKTPKVWLQVAGLDLVIS